MARRSFESNGRYKVVAKVESSSRPGEYYEVAVELATGRISCNCPAWIYQKAAPEDRQPCKHIRKYEAALDQICLRSR